MSVVMPAETEVRPIYCAQSFDRLILEEKLYAYHFAMACLRGQPIPIFQKSYESPALYIVFLRLFASKGLAELEQSFKKLGGTPEQWKYLLAYVGAVLGEAGNYKSFGSTKFIPGLPLQLFNAFVKEHSAGKEYGYWQEIQPFVYGHEGKLAKLGFHQTCTTAYYSANMTQPEIDLVDAFLKSKNIQLLNTLIFKEDKFVVHVASVNKEEQQYEHQGHSIIVRKGMFGEFLQGVCSELEQAAKHTDRPLQKEFIDLYSQHFRTGDVALHVRSQEVWVKDTNPVIQTNIGFIQTYEDPKQVRAEWEGFTAIVDKDESKKVAQLVNEADALLKMMPWPAEYEKDVFLKPDFTSLMILAFNSSSTPKGINIPNYDDVRQDTGFKNVFLSNSGSKPKKINYATTQDSNLIINLFSQVAFHQVSFHQLMGHGCGKLFMEKEDGSLNFNAQMKDPYREGKVGYYKKGENWNTIFKDLSNNMEQCRADSVALYFSCIPDAVTVLQPELKGSQEQLCYATFLMYVKMAIDSLQFYDVSQKRWMQAHCNGRYVILRVLLENAPGLIQIHAIEEEGKQSLRFTVDRSRVMTDGKKAISDFLFKLNALKATANAEHSREWFTALSTISQEHLKLRAIHLANAKPRPIEIQGSLSLVDGVPVYKTYEESFPGIIQWKLDTLLPELDRIETLWNAVKGHLRPIV